MTSLSILPFSEIYQQYIVIPSVERGIRAGLGRFILDRMPGLRISFWLNPC